MNSDTTMNLFVPPPGIAYYCSNNEPLCVDNITGVDDF